MQKCEEKLLLFPPQIFTDVRGTLARLCLANNRQKPKGTYNETKAEKTNPLPFYMYYACYVA
jgi:hypothetical protein